jgi:hypothetical protein
MRDLLFRPACELAGLVRQGQVSARELVQTFDLLIANKQIVDWAARPQVGASSAGRDVQDFSKRELVTAVRKFGL